MEPQPDSEIYAELNRLKDENSVMNGMLVRAGDMRQKFESHVAELEAELNRLRHVCLAFAETAEHAVHAAEEATKGGQHVPYHGDFANAPVSVVSRLRWWAREFRAALGGGK